MLITKMVLKLKCMLTISLAIATHFDQKKAPEVCLTCYKITGFELLVKHLCLQQHSNLACQDRLLGCGCIAIRRLNCFNPLIHCHISAEQISASITSHSCHHHRTEENKSESAIQKRKHQEFKIQSSNHSTDFYFIQCVSTRDNMTETKFHTVLTIRSFLRVGGISNKIPTGGCV